MKQRLGFVSNSSSSSFIITADDPESVFMIASITKQDLIEAIVDLSGGPEHFINAQIEASSYCGDKPFVVLDRRIKEDKDRMLSGEFDFLKHWRNSCLQYKPDKYPNDPWIRVSDPMHMTAFNNAYDVIRSVYSLSYDYDINDPKNNVISSYDPIKKEYVEKPVPEHVDKVIRDLYAHCGVTDNLTVLKQDFATILMHFGDNEVWELKGTDESGKFEELSSGDSPYARERNEKIKNSTWETDSNTGERIAEVLFRWFKDHGKFTSEAAQKLTWRDLWLDFVACTVHEG